MADLSDTPAAMIARLDAALARRGQDVILRKTNSAAGQITVRGRMRDRGRSVRADELVGIINQENRVVVISPTGLASFGVPLDNGFVVVNSEAHRIEKVYPIHVGGVLVRIELQVKGS